MLTSPFGFHKYLHSNLPTHIQSTYTIHAYNTYIQQIYTTKHIQVIKYNRNRSNFYLEPPERLFGTESRMVDNTENSNALYKMIMNLFIRNEKSSVIRHLHFWHWLKKSVLCTFCSNTLKIRRHRSLSHLSSLWPSSVWELQSSASCSNNQA